MASHHAFSDVVAEFPSSCGITIRVDQRSA
jgi:hypothetical protein